MHCSGHRMSPARRPRQFTEWNLRWMLQSVDHRRPTSLASSVAQCIFAAQGLTGRLSFWGDEMSGKGLDDHGRNAIAAMVDDHKDGTYVLRAIDHRVRTDRFDYNANLRFMSWLRSRRYNETATYLARYLDGWTAVAPPLLAVATHPVIFHLGLRVVKGVDSAPRSARGRDRGPRRLPADKPTAAPAWRRSAARIRTGATASAAWR